MKKTKIGNDQSRVQPQQMPKSKNILKISVFHTQLKTEAVKAKVQDKLEADYKFEENSFSWDETEKCLDAHVITGGKKILPGPDVAYSGFKNLVEYFEFENMKVLKEIKRKLGNLDDLDSDYIMSKIVEGGYFFAHRLVGRYELFRFDYSFPTDIEHYYIDDFESDEEESEGEEPCEF